MRLTGLRLAALLLVLAGATAAFIVPSPLIAAGQNRAGIVVRHGDGTVRDMCVFFDEAEISGYELLERSGIAFEAEGYGDRNAICKIGSEGCSPSQGEDCLECKKPDSWVYWVRNSGESTWAFSPVGADDRDVRNGSIDGWSWGEGSKASKPPALAFSDVCPAVAASTTAPRPVAPSGGGTSGGGNRPSSDGESSAGGSDGLTGSTETERLELENGTSPEPSDEASPSATDGERNEAQGSTDEDDTEPASYLMFGGFALVFVLIAAGLYFMRRRRAQSGT